MNLDRDIILCAGPALSLARSDNCMGHQEGWGAAAQLQIFHFQVMHAPAAEKCHVNSHFITDLILQKSKNDT